MDNMEWSEYLGAMPWHKAKAYAENLGMRLPTVKELKSAYEAGITKEWEEDGHWYWTSEEYSAERAYNFYIVNGLSYYDLKVFNVHVRCIR